jgi:hypothetical protein
MNKKELILSLIKDNLRNTHLVESMNKLWSDSDKHHLYLSDTIFELLGFKGGEHEEMVFEEYIKASMKVTSIDIYRYPERLEVLAITIYNDLRRCKPKDKK